MNELRQKFEALPEIADSLSASIVFIGNKYTTHLDGFYDLVNWLNGAWYAFQEQQKKIDEIIDLCNNNRGDIHWQVDSFIEEIEGLLK